MKSKKILGTLVLSFVMLFVFATAVFASTVIGDLTITSNYSDNTQSFNYTNANADARYAVNDVSLSGSTNRARFKTTLQKKSGFLWLGKGTRTSTVTTKYITVRVTWDDIASGTYRYHIAGSEGTVYATLTVNNY